MTLYFSDRENGPPARTHEEIDEAVWGGLYVLISRHLADGSLGHRFPDVCPDGYGICGHDDEMLSLAVAAELRGMTWPLSPADRPTTMMILDLLEFIANSVGTPIKGFYHPFFRHYHLTFDHEDGRVRFAADVNSLFQRNGIAYEELTDDGHFRRLLPVGLGEILSPTMFRTGDTETDRLLETARQQILKPHKEVRQDALEKLWDAFERLKTLEPGKDKRSRADALLDKATRLPARFRTLLADEAGTLTDMGNNYRIRHSETTQEPLTDPAQIDYFFARMFAFVRYLLKQTGRGG